MLCLGLHSITSVQLGRGHLQRRGCVGPGAGGRAPSQGSDAKFFLLTFQPCQFDCAVFCPNLTEVSTAGNAGKEVTGTVPERGQGAFRC